MITVIIIIRLSAGQPALRVALPRRWRKTRRERGGDGEGEREREGERESHRERVGEREGRQEAWRECWMTFHGAVTNDDLYTP